MRTITLLFLCFVGLAVGDDIRIANGRTYKDIEIVSADDQAIFIKHGPYHEGVKIPWSWLTQEQRAKLEPAGKQKAEATATQQKVVASGLPFRLKIRQSTAEVVLADYQVGTVVVAKGPTYIDYSRVAAEPIAVSGLDKLVDGDRWEGVLYPTGIYRYTTVMGAEKSVRSFTASPEKALEQMKQ